MTEVTWFSFEGDPPEKIRGLKKIDLSDFSKGKGIESVYYYPKQEWIKCSDRIPEPHDYVLVYSELNGPSRISIARQNMGKFEMLCEGTNSVACGDISWEMDSEDITHWTPLTKPPVKEEK